MKFSTGVSALTTLAGLTTAAPYSGGSIQTVQISEKTVLCVQNNNNCFISVTEISATITRQNIGVASSGHGWDVTPSHYGDHHWVEKGTVVYNPVTHVEYRIMNRIDSAACRIDKAISRRDEEETSSQPEFELVGVEARDIPDTQNEQANEDDDDDDDEDFEEEKRDLLPRYVYDTTKVSIININIDYTFSRNGHTYRIVERASSVRVYFAKGGRKTRSPAPEPEPVPSTNQANKSRFTFTFQAFEQLYIGGRHIQLLNSLSVTVIQLS
ncbi:hypothetical protein GQ53DRAFT_760891 [Thozetella sp. PMI_491]|nr:hypothetical protein GQ53DRAFT_760891 [Thozetella sp. PMI_491]